MSTILLVEDDPQSQTVVQDIFRYDNLPSELVCVGSAEEALQVLPSLNPHVVLMDLMLPGINGIEATRIIRMREQEEHRPPVCIIAVTASVAPDDRRQCLAAGMNDYLSKPVRRNTLTEILRKCCPPDRHEEGRCAQTGTVPFFPAMIEEPLVS
jgi:CheY-like chemotaxis protein